MKKKTDPDCLSHSLGPSSTPENASVRDSTRTTYGGVKCECVGVCECVCTCVYVRICMSVCVGIRPLKGRTVYFLDFESLQSIQ